MKKTNKTFKRFAAITSASLLAACAIAPVAFNAVAADETYSITITNSNDNVSIAGKTYTAYKVLGLEYQVVDGKTVYKYFLDDSCLNSEGYTDYTSEDALGNLTVSITDDNARTFADMVYNTYIKGKTVSEDVTSIAGVVAEGSETVTLNPSEPGYYIVVGTSVAEDGGSDVTSLVMLDTADPDVTINTKLDAPELKKEIKHNELDTWGVVGDNQIGDTVNYKITTTMPDPVYVTAFGIKGSTYEYVIHDHMTTGLDFDPDSVLVKIGESTLTKNTHYTIAEECKDTFETGLKEGQATGESFEIVFNMAAILADDSLKTIATKGAEIITTYDCTLTKDALVASTATDDNNSNDNTAYLEFSNNPYASEGEDSTGETVEDTVYDWTFTYTVDKINEAGDQHLSGAVFNVKEESEFIKFTKLTGDGYTDKDYYVVDKNGTVIDITTSGKEFVLVGLDDATTYTLIEKSAPTGYNKCDDITFVISDTYDGTPNGISIASISATNTQGDKTLDAGNTIDVINKTGTVLPGTGGIGTTIFYLGGGAMAAIGGIYLISKRRMKKSEE